MIDFPLKYESSYFADLTEIRPSALTIPPLLAVFQDKGFLPSMFMEKPNDEPRIRLTSPNEQWEITVRRQRVVITKRPIERDRASMGTVGDFCVDAVEILDRLFRQVPPRKGSRVSLITEELMPQMSEESLNDLYVHLFKPVPFYQENSPTEWLLRWVARTELQVNGIAELVNVINMISRVQGQIADPSAITVFDRIQLGFDINTFQGNTDTRFTPDNIEDFYRQAMEVRDQLIKQLEAHLNG